jgi:hypothetical protein
MFNLILCLIGGFQVLFVIVTAFLVNRVVIPEDVMLLHKIEIQKRFGTKW